MRQSSGVAVVSMALLLSGCAIQNSQLGQAVALDTREVGYVAATLVSRQLSATPGETLAELPGITASFYTSGRNPERAFALNSSSASRINGHWRDPVAKTSDRGDARLMLLVPVRPGRYLLRHVRAEYPGKHNVMADLFPDFYPTIEVKAGEVTYVGSIRVVTRLGHNVTGEPRPAGTALEIQNDFALDSAAITAADARLRALPLRNGLPH